MAGLLVQLNCLNHPVLSCFHVQPISGYIAKHRALCRRPCATRNQHPIRIPSYCDWVWSHQFPLLKTNHIWAGLLSSGGQGICKGLQCRMGFDQQPSISLDNMCPVACLWLGCCKRIYSSSYCHITTCDIGVIEKQEFFFGHNWLSMWIEIQLQFANCIILIESCYNLLKLKSTCSHWIIGSFYLRLIQF